MNWPRRAFLGSIHQSYDSSKFVVLPVPFGKGSSLNYMDKGPEHILDASARLQKYDCDFRLDPSEAGIYTQSDVQSWPMPENFHPYELHLNKILGDGKIPAILGGSHAITPDAVRAFVEAFDDLSVLVLDASAELGPVDGWHNIATNLRQLPGLHDGVVMVGARSYAKEELENTRDGKYLTKLITMGDIRAYPATGIFSSWAHRIVDAIDSDNVYLSVDLSIFDPSIIPAVGSPEPNGLSWNDVMSLLRILTLKKNLVGFDICELCPRAELPHCDYFAAKLVYKIMGYIQDKPMNTKNKVDSSGDR